MRPATAPRSFDLHPDGDRVVFIFNFFDELRRVAPGKP